MRNPEGQKNESGMSLIELMIAVLVLMVGVVAVAQLVPSAMRSNLANREDSTAVIVAQRMMEVLQAPPLTVFGPITADPFQPSQVINQFGPGNPGPTSCNPIVDCTNIQLGNGLAPVMGICGPTAPAWWGSPVTAVDAINWTLPSPPGYHAIVIDPTNPNQAAYEVRWAVDTRWGRVPCTGAVTPVMKRFVVSVRRMVTVSQSRFIPPTSLTVVRTNGQM